MVGSASLTNFNGDPDVLKVLVVNPVGSDGDGGSAPRASVVTVITAEVGVSEEPQLIVPYNADRLRLWVVATSGDTVYVGPDDTLAVSGETVANGFAASGLASVPITAPSAIYGLLWSDEETDPEATGRVVLVEESSDPPPAPSDGSDDPTTISRYVGQAAWAVEGTAVQIAAQDDWRTKLHVRVNGDGVVYVGDDAVTVETGIPVTAATPLVVENEAEVWAVAADNLEEAVDVRVLWETND